MVLNSSWDDGKNTIIYFPKLVKQLFNARVKVEKLSPTLRYSRVRIISTNYNQAVNQSQLNKNQNDLINDQKISCEKVISNSGQINKQKVQSDNDQKDDDEYYFAEPGKKKSMEMSKPYCPVCNRTFNDDISKKTCSVCKTMYLYKCMNCNEQYSKYRNLLSHIKYKCKHKTQSTRTNNLTRVHTTTKIKHVETTEKVDKEKITKSKIIDIQNNVQSKVPDVQSSIKVAKVNDENKKQSESRCRYCNIQFPTCQSLLRHQNQCKREPIKCSFCSFKTKYSFNIKRHVFRIHKKQYSLIIANSKNQDSLKSKQKKKAKNIKHTSKHVSSYCQVNGQSQDFLKFIKGYCLKCRCTVHFINVQLSLNCSKCTEKLLWKCCKCDKKKSSFYTLMKHIKRMHFKEKCLLKCPNCNKKFNNERQMYYHIKFCTSNIYYPCKHCSYKTKYPGNMKSHYNTHHPDLPFSPVGLSKKANSKLTK